MTEFSEKAKTIGVSLKRGQTQLKRVINEDNGTEAGYHREYWDDRQDAVAMPKAIKVKARQEDQT